MCAQDIAYLQHRAAVERQQAEIASCPQAALVHASLAKAYQARIASAQADGRTSSV